MCLIAVHDASTPLSDADVRAIFNANSDGMGAMWAHAGQVKIVKSMPLTAEEAVAFYREQNEYVGQGTIIWHWRYATHGATSLEMCHPFRMRIDAAMVHNGVIAGYGNKRLSDTADFVKQHMAMRPHESVDWAMVAKKTEGSRVAVMTATEDGGSDILYFGSWEQHGTAWVSNLYWRPWTSRYTQWNTGLWADALDDATEPNDEDMAEVMEMVEEALRLGMSKREAIEYASYFTEYPDAYRSTLEAVYDVE